MRSPFSAALLFFIASMFAARPMPVTRGEEKPPAVQPAAPKPDREATVGDPDEVAKRLKAGGNTAPGLKLPENFAVATDDMLVDLTAECDGAVTWLVVSSSKRIKYRLESEESKTITVGIPPYKGGCVISVFCVGVVNGKFTKWARTDITVNDAAGDQEADPPPAPSPSPAPGPGPQPPTQVVPKGAKLAYTVIEDASQRTLETRLVIESVAVRQAIGQGGVFRVKDKLSPDVATFVNFLSKKSVPLPALVVQLNDGTQTAKPAVWYGPLPKSEADMLSLIARLQKGN